MFIEVYKIPTVNWNDPSADSAIPRNRKLINTNAIKDVDYSDKCDGRAEIEYSDGRRCTVVGSYDEIVERICNATIDHATSRVVLRSPVEV